MSSVTTPAGRELIRLEGVFCSRSGRRGGVDVLRGIDLALSAGESVSVVGASGAGKTTLLAAAGVTLRPTRGLVFVNGAEAWGMGDRERAALRASRLGFVLQRAEMITTLTLQENCALPALLAGASATVANERAREALGRFGLQGLEACLPGEISGGERRRAAVARATVNRPALVLADEPTGDLDDSAAARVADALFGLVGAGTALLLVTHDRDLAARATKRYVLRDGRLDEEQ